MWNWSALCVLIILWQDVNGNIRDEMTEIIQRCCNEGSRTARSGTEQVCSSSQPVPADVASSFGSLCIMARAQCCKEYFQKKKDCDRGISIESSKNQCDSTKDSAKVCCDECARGTSIGQTRGAAACVVRASAENAEELLSNDAYVQCCLKAAREKPTSITHPVSTTKKEKREHGKTLASLCEDYAPNELCAHHCIPVPGSYKCECNPGYMLMADGRNCKEVVKNRCKPHNHCQHKCNDNGVEVMCSCRRGYELMPDGKSCQDIDECQLDISICRPNTQCHNIQGSYRCIPVKSNNHNRGKGKCPPGFARKLNSHVCDDINECKLPNPPCSAYLCENTVGGYKCGGVSGDPVNLNSTPRPMEDRCPPGFALGRNGDCEDVDECATSKDDCNPLSQHCINTHSSFFCQDKESKHCQPGFKINPQNNKCEDINECEEEGLCRSDQVCVNQLGQYDCKMKVDEAKLKNQQCPEGMRMNRNSLRCDDIDECLEGTHFCDQHQNCLNTNGSFECHCKLGYELDVFTGACVDVNECATNQHNCRPDVQRCDNTVGSFLCIRITSCGTGYVLQHSTGNCEDIDECALGNHNCARAGPEYQCFNIPGSFRCARRKQPSTTTTTLSPDEYEDEYYYVDEEVGGNQTSADPKVPLPSPTFIPPTEPTQAPVPTSTEPVLRKEEPRFEDNSVMPDSERSDGRQDPSPRPEVSEPTEPQYTTPPVQYSPPPVNRPEEPRHQPEEPRYQPEEPRYQPEEPRYQPEQPTQQPSQPSYNSEPPRQPQQPENQPNINSSPDISYSEPRFERPIQPEIVYKEPSGLPQHRETPDSTYYETRNEPEKPISNEIIPDNTERPREPERSTEPEPTIVLETEPPIVRFEPEPSSTFSPYRPSVRTDITRPYQVDVKVEENSATVSGERREDGSVVVDTKEVPQNKWTSINVKPAPCPPGFEAYDYGGCFDIDECATKQHSCSGLTETCRNTRGGYLCDCASSLRRDQTTGACVLITVSSTTPLPSIFNPDSIPSINPTYYPDPVPSSTPAYYPDPVPSNTPVYYPDPVPSSTPVYYPDTAPSSAPEFHPDPVPSNTPVYSPDPVPSSTTSTTTEPPPPTTPSTTPEPVPSTTQRATTPKSRTFWGYKDDRFAATRPFYPSFWCDAGYQRNMQTGRCEDINECTNGIANCAAVEVCVNTEGGYVCECPPGWTLDNVRHRCVPAARRGEFPPGYGNEPVYPPQVDQQEIVRHVEPDPEITQIEDRGTVLKCPWGYRLGDDHNCVDVNECATGEAKCGPIQICTNLPGGYTCSCPPGYRLTGDHVCEDVDECDKAGNVSICSHNADCVNTIGSYICKCHEGFRPAPVNDKVCVDVDECSESRPGSLCQHRCSNVWGSYRCFCHRGYRLSADNRTCADVDECVQFKSKVPCVGKCLNEPGSYRCDCPPGYRLSEDKRSCIDIDECETGEATCQSGMYAGTSHNCFNTRGSYRCLRITCPPGYQLENKHRCTKTERVCSPGDWECAHQPSTISYNFITFVSNLLIPESNVNLFTMRGPTWPYAKMKFELKLLDVNAPPSVKNRADINTFLLIQKDNEGFMSLVRPLEGPQSIELELSMELYSREQFGGIAVAKLFIFVSEYEF